MRITKKEILENKIFSIDNFYDSVPAAKMWRHANSCQWSNKQTSDPYANEVQERMTHHINPDDFKRLALWEKIQETLDFPIEFIEAYLNCSDASTVTLPHCDNTDGGMSILICINQEWNRNWGGYTCFFEEMNSDKIIETICPEPRKAVFFAGSIYHYALPTINRYPYWRFMLAIKTKYKNDEEV